jgi:thioredoxin reductase
MTLAIVGGGLAGATAAAELRERGYDGPVVLYAAERILPYDRQPYFFTDQYDLGMEYVGYVGPDGYDRVTIEGDTAAAFRAYWERDGVVVAAMHANDWGASDEIRASIGTSRKD